jgi:3-dehydroquinate dehydratase/shikimate dehydrogenase
MRVEGTYEDFKAFLDAFLARPWLDLHGLSVTIPHKEHLVRYVREHIARHGPDAGHIEPLADRIGVANTLVIEHSALSTQHSALNSSHITHHSSLRIYNTDYAGALDALTAGMQIDREGLRDMRIAVLGAGGAARAVVAGLRDCGAIVYIYNRTGSKARALAAEFGCVAMPWDSREMIDSEVLINTTSIGMWPKVNESPLPREHIPPNILVFDTIANPIETRLLRDAKARGCQTLSGLTMFINQAALQFNLWTGLEPPREVMRQVVVRRLSGK